MSGMLTTCIRREAGVNTLSTIHIKLIIQGCCFQQHWLVITVPATLSPNALPSLIDLHSVLLNVAHTTALKLWTHSRNNTVTTSLHNEFVSWWDRADNVVTLHITALDIKPPSFSPHGHNNQLLLNRYTHYTWLGNRPTEFGIWNMNNILSTSDQDNELKKLDSPAAISYRTRITDETKS